MSDSVRDAAGATSVAKSKARKAVGSSKTAKATPALPSTAEMVITAIQSLKARGGSSLKAIKKFISSTYKIDVERRALLIRKFLKSAADDGTLIRTKGTGAAGSFKLPTEASKKAATAKSKETSATKKKTATAKPKTAASSPKKGTSTPKKPAAKVAKKAAVKPTPVKQPAAKKAAKTRLAKKRTQLMPKKAATKNSMKKALPTK